MTTDEATGKRPGYPTTNGRVVPTDVSDRAGLVASPLSDQVGSEATSPKRPKRPGPVVSEATDAKRPGRFGWRRREATEKATEKATGEATETPKRPDRTKRPDQVETTTSKRPKQPRRLGRLIRRRRDRESLEAQARRAWLDDQGATVGIPRGYGWAFLALVVTTVVSAGAAFWFVFGNVTDTASMVGVPWAQQRAVSPTIDVIVIGLTVYVQYLALANGDPKVIALTRRLLVGASLIMLAMNATPPVLAALTTDYEGPLRRATADFTPTFDQMTTGQLWGRAGLDIVITGILVAWSHYGPKVVAGLASIRARSDRAALRLVEERTFATASDRAAAASDRAEATALLDHAHAEATDLLDRARAEATALVVSARSEAAGILEAARGERAQAVAAARSAGDTTAEATTMRERAEREAAAIVTEAEQLAARYRAAVDDERAQIVEARRQLEEGRAQLAQAVDKLADDRRALEDLAADLEREATAPDPAPEPPARPAPRTTNSAPAAGKAKTTPSGRAPRRRVPEQVAEGVAKCKEDFPDWAAKTPKKDDIMRACGTYGELALKIRDQLVTDSDTQARAAAGSN